MKQLSNDDIAQLAAQLQAQRLGLLAIIRQRQGESLERDSADLQEVEEAIARLGDGSYGVCAGCAAPIAMRRLRTQPAARLCLTCQASFEQHRQLRPAPAR